jgi:UDP-N-acetylmuramate--alanine ligase
LTALRNIFPQRRLIVAFQPHRYSRTAAHVEGFAEALSLADVVVLSPIYPADETPIVGVDSVLIAKAMEVRGFNQVSLALSMDEVAELVFNQIRTGDIFVTVGAGNIFKLGKRLLSLTRDRGHNVVAIGS